MRKSYSSNLNWSEQARRRQAIFTVGGLAVGGFVIGGFVIGIIFSLVTDYLRPASSREGARVSAVGHIPIYATPAPFTAADPVEPASPSRSRPSAAEVTPARNNTRALTPPPDTNGRGGATDGRGGSAVVSPKDMARVKASEDRLKRIMQICREC